MRHVLSGGGYGSPFVWERDMEPDGLGAEMRQGFPHVVLAPYGGGQ